MITSLQNNQIKTARKLKERRQRYAEGQLLLEGLHLVEDAWRSGVEPLQVFYTLEARQQNHEVESLLATFEHANIALLPCTEAAFASLTETVTPQGIAAVVPLPQLPIPPQPGLILILDGVRDPGNAGTLLRSAEAAGVELVIFGPGTVDPFNDKVLRSGMGAHFRLPLRVCSVWSQVEALIPTHLSLYLAEATAPLDYAAVDWRVPAGLVVGGEAAGAGAEMRQNAHPIAIPMQGKTESLNAAMAGTVILFEVARQRRTQ
ncbi:MAG: RNA methyltransferase [Caldilineaceae bacterium]